MIGDWIELYDHQHKSYYFYNRITHEALWELPENAGQTQAKNTLPRKSSQSSLGDNSTLTGTVFDTTNDGNNSTSLNGFINEFDPKLSQYTTELKKQKSVKAVAIQNYENHFETFDEKYISDNVSTNDIDFHSVRSKNSTGSKKSRNNQFAAISKLKRELVRLKNETSQSSLVSNITPTERKKSLISKLKEAHDEQADEDSDSDISKDNENERTNDSGNESLNNESDSDNHTSTGVSISNTVNGKTYDEFYEDDSDDSREYVDENGNIVQPKKDPNITKKKKIRSGRRSRKQKQNYKRTDDDEDHYSDASYDYSDLREHRKHDYYEYAASYKLTRPYMDRYKKILCVICLRSECFDFFFPCEHRCVCRSCLVKQNFAEFKSEHIQSISDLSPKVLSQTKPTQVSSFASNCPLCGAIIQKILENERGRERERYWEWLYAIKNPPSDAFMSRFKHTQGMIETVFINDGNDSKNNNKKSSLCALS